MSVSELTEGVSFPFQGRLDADTVYHLDTA